MTPWLLLLSLTSGATEPWYARAECQAGLREVHSQELQRARQAIDALYRSADDELKLCALWLEIPLGNAELVLEGRSESLFERREDRLRALHGAAQRFGRGRSHWVDVAVEARMRRIQLLAQKGERTESVTEARRVLRQLERREGAPPSPSRSYARGAIDLAVGQATWALRMLLSAAGISGDPEAGQRALEELAASDTVYASEALLLLRQLSKDSRGADAPQTLRYGAQLVARFPESPQFAMDHAADLLAAGRVADAGKVLAPFERRLQVDPELWSGRVRRNLSALFERTDGVELSAR